MANINPLLAGAMGSLKSEAQKALNEDLKKIARRILEQQALLGKIAQEAEAKSKAAEEAIELMNEEAAKAQREFVERFGALEAVKNPEA